MNLNSRADLRALEKRIIELLEPVSQECKVQFSFAGGRFQPDGSRVDLKLRCARLGEDGMAQTPEREQYALYCRSLGLPPESLDFVFASGGEKYRLDGIKARASRYPLLGKRLSDGKVFLFPADVVKAQWDLQQNVGKRPRGTEKVAANG